MSANIVNSRYLVRGRDGKISVELKRKDAPSQTVVMICLELDLSNTMYCKGDGWRQACETGPDCLPRPIARAAGYMYGPLMQVTGRVIGTICINVNLLLYIVM